MRRLYILILISLFSCSEKKSIKIKHVYEVGHEIDKFGKDYFINNINDIKFSDSTFYIIDDKIPRLIQLDKNFNYISSTGEKGKGPNEFLTMGFVAVNSFEYIISDRVDNSVSYYNKKTNIIKKRIHLPENIFLNSGDFFADDEGNLTVIFMSKDSTKLGIYSTFKNEFHPFELDINNPKESMATSFIGKLDDNFIVAIPRFSNELYFFSRSNYDLLKKITIDFPENSFAAWQDLRKKGKRTPLITDGCLNGQDLYLIYQDFANSSRALARLKVSSNFELLRADFYGLPKGNGDECLYADDEMIVTFSRKKCTLQKYPNLTNDN